jgi:DNA primase
VCPFHDDRNPSLCVKAGGTRFRCFGCGAGGDAIDLLRLLNPGTTFAEARAVAEGGTAPAAGAVSKPPRRARPAERPAGWDDFALRVVAEAEAALWSPSGRPALNYLRGRGLADGTARAARLGAWASDTFDTGAFPGERVRVPAGVVIPWFEGGRVAMLNVRRPAGAVPKYHAVRGSRRGGVYPSARTPAAGLPLVIVEGEFEALLLGQELAGLAAVVTLGGAADGPGVGVLNALAVAPAWHVATDADDAGEKAAERWLGLSARAGQVRPPGAFKDWTEAAQAGVNLRRWWGDVLGGAEKPPLFTWEELSAWRWGAAAGEPAPGVDFKGRSGAPKPADGTP